MIPSNQFFEHNFELNNLILKHNIKHGIFKNRSAQIFEFRLCSKVIGQKLSNTENIPNRIFLNNSAKNQHYFSKNGSFCSPCEELSENTKKVAKK